MRPGLEPRIDTAANIFATRAGTDPTLKPILFGSHIDSVPSGGNFDGDLGSLSAIEAVRTLHDHGVTTRHPLQVVIWSNEEGGTIGSRAAVGDLTPEDLERSYNGFTRADGIRRLGGDPARLGDARLAPGAFHCYLELHIEQGGNLFKTGIPVGVVEGIVSIDEYDVEIRGFANHAGTTPMPERRNALLAAAKLIEVVQAVVTAEPGRQVGNVGRLEVFPGARNVVPGLVKHSLELRDLSPEKIARLGKEIQRRAQTIAQETGTTITITQIEHDPPAIATPEVQAAIEAVAADLGLKTTRLPSGAGHDAQNIARLVPMGMIFVPSVDGISHSPRELTQLGGLRQRRQHAPPRRSPDGPRLGRSQCRALLAYFTTFATQFAGFAIVRASRLSRSITIAIAIGANTAMFSFVHGLLLSPLPYPESDQ